MKQLTIKNKVSASQKNTTSFKGAYTVRENLSDLTNDPTVKKRTEEARRFLDQHGLPKGLPEWKK